MHGSSSSVEQALGTRAARRAIGARVAKPAGARGRPRAEAPAVGDVVSAARHADAVVVALVLADGEEQLEEVIRSLRQRGVQADLVVVGAGDRKEPTISLDSLLGQGEVYSDPLLTVDFRQRRAELCGRELALTPLEFRLLGAFVRRQKQVLSHEQLLELAWGTNVGSRGSSSG